MGTWKMLIGLNRLKQRIKEIDDEIIKKNTKPSVPRKTKINCPDIFKELTSPAEIIPTPVLSSNFYF